MGKYLSLAVAVVSLPCIYWGIMMLQRSSFEKEENQTRVPLRSVAELAVMASAEAALVSVWYKEVYQAGDYMTFWLLFAALAGMTVVCITDYRERIVPNRVLLLMLVVSVWIIGFQGVRDMDAVLRVLPSIVLGFLFCLLSFGMGYFFSRGNMGAGDVKLALVLGILLTGEYVVGAILYGCIAAAVYSIIQMIRKKLTRKDMIPFVPFLYIGLIIEYFVR